MRSLEAAPPPGANAGTIPDAFTAEDPVPAAFLDARALSAAPPPHAPHLRATPISALSYRQAAGAPVEQPLGAPLLAVSRGDP